MEKKEDIPVPETKEVNVFQEKFISLTDLVIREFESGYYHPDMKKRMSPKDQGKMGKSGETMYGIDRRWGTALKKYPEWAEFWDLIDKAGARTKWPHYYKGGDLAPELRRLVASMMYKWFNSLYDRYVFEKGKEAIVNDPRLIVHFSYACWNGAGWFQRFATALNNAVDHLQDKEAIFQEAMKARVFANNSLIRQGGNKMMKLFVTQKELFK